MEKENYKIKNNILSFENYDLKHKVYIDLKLVTAIRICGDSLVVIYFNNTTEMFYVNNSEDIEILITYFNLIKNSLN